MVLHIRTSSFQSQKSGIYKKNVPPRNRTLTKRAGTFCATFTLMGLLGDNRLNKLK